MERRLECSKCRAFSDLDLDSLIMLRVMTAHSSVQPLPMVVPEVSRSQVAASSGGRWRGGCPGFGWRHGGGGNYLPCAKG